MNTPLPDVSHSERAPVLSPLEWVGMQNIDLPVKVVEPNYERELHARIDMQVDLPSPHIKGIHMSRLYRLADEDLGRGQPLTPKTFHQVLQQLLASQLDCGSGNARLRMKLNLLIRRSALVTEGLSGWKSYPVCINASLIQGTFKLRVKVTAEYSSTCPCSAALSRQLIERAFRKDFGGEEKVDLTAVSTWLQQHATLATPHSQRSEAKVAVTLENEDAPDLGLLSLIDQIEEAVATPVQTAVKRADEQAFAALNGQNQMFVEDAARRIQATLEYYSDLEVHVRHVESLHPHDAVAWSTSNA
ncbi:MAG: GTP cyclohydrolase FolE2 [Sneathiella sp.]